MLCFLNVGIQYNWVKLIPYLTYANKSAFDLLINKELNNIYNIGIWRDSFLTELDLYDRR